MRESFFWYWVDNSIMIEYLVLVSFIGFLLFLVPGRHRKYTAILGWIFIILALFANLPEYFSENNFLYPLIAALSVPFLVITAKYLLAEDERVMNLSRAAAVAFIIYAPFEYIPTLGDWLIGIVVGQVVFILGLLHFPVTLDAWNIIMNNAFRVEIILGCTGIQSIAIMLGVSAAVPTTLKQKVLAFLLIAPTIYFLNLLRNVFVIMAYTEQWFPYWPEIASNGEYGYESFFWAHNVIAEVTALIILVVIAYCLFLIIPRLGTFADELYQLYSGEVMRSLQKRE
ncbi:MAG: archaeosortase A [Methanomicrobiales archaeon]|nr:archaeosortase A [Methanomicrobiales archaeon]